MEKLKIKKAVLAYSGGIDTSVIIPWLRENCDCEIIAVCCDVGQGSELSGIEMRAINSGAAKCYVEHITEELVDKCLFPGLKAGAVYEQGYLLGTAFARPMIAKTLVEIAHREAADTIVHGATGKSNDQVRFEMAVKALDPRLNILAPWRVWDIRTREEELEYAEKHGIFLGFSKYDGYSRDRNIWHIMHEGLDLEHPEMEPDYGKVLDICVIPECAPNVPEYITVSFEHGIPVAINGKRYSGVELIAALNDIGGRNGIGITDIVENRLFGMKCRCVYEAPGAAILHYAHRILESLTLDKESAHYKQLLGQKFAEIVYNGQWFTPLRKAVCAFVDSTQEPVTGDVKLKLYKGNIISVGTESPYSLYSAELATFGVGNLYDPKDAEGFINLYSFPLTARALTAQKLKEQGLFLPPID